LLRNTPSMVTPRTSITPTDSSGPFLSKKYLESETFNYRRVINCISNSFCIAHPPNYPSYSSNAKNHLNERGFITTPHFN